MNIGLVGLEKSGKPTIFNALTGMRADVASFGSQKAEPNLAVVPVLDPRVDALSRMFEPKKTIYATVQVTDFVGLTDGAAKSGVFSGAAMGLVKTADALAVVLRNFSDETLDGVLGKADPLKDLSVIAGELILSDQIVAEKRLERIAADIQKGKKTPALVAEEKVLQTISAALNEGRPVRTLGLSAEDRRSMSGFQLLTEKPLFVILNSDEERYGKNQAVITEIEKLYPVIEFAGNFEMELSRLSAEDAALFMAEMGIIESAHSRLTTFAYRILGYISFFTVGKDEVRAWTIRNGETAVDAAGTIHTDLARGFIRAECFSYDALMEAGSEKGVRDRGAFRLEGKTYLVQDGDILNIRFSI